MGIINKILIVLIILLLILLQTLSIDYELNYLKCGGKVLYTLILDIPLVFYLLYSLIGIKYLSIGSLSIQWMLYSISLSLKFYYLTYPYKIFNPLDGFKHLNWSKYITHYQGYFALTPIIYLLYHKLSIELSNISIWLHEMLHMDLCISTTIDIWDVITIAHEVPNLLEYKNIMFAFVMCNILSLGLVLPTTGIQGICKDSDWRRDSDIFIVVKFTYLIGLFMIDIPFLTFRIYNLSHGRFNILFLKNFLFIFMRSFRLAIWQLAYRDAVKWNDSTKPKENDIKPSINIKISASESKQVERSDLTKKFTRTNFHKSTLRKVGFKEKTTSAFERFETRAREVDISGFDLSISLKEYFNQFGVIFSHLCTSSCESYISEDIKLSLFKRIRLVIGFVNQPLAHIALIVVVNLGYYNRMILIILGSIMGSLTFLCDFFTAPHVDVLYNILYSIISLISTGYSLHAFSQVNGFYVRLFSTIAFSFFPVLALIPNIVSIIGSIINIPYSCHKLLIMSCRWCIAPVSHHGMILGGEITKNVTLTDQLLQAHWTGVALLVVSKLFCTFMHPDWIIYLLHIGFSISYVILSQTIRILQQRKYEIQFLQKSSQRQDSIHDEMKYISTFGLFSCPGHLLPPIF